MDGKARSLGHVELLLPLGYPHRTIKQAGSNVALDGGGEFWKRSGAECHQTRGDETCKPRVFNKIIQKQGGERKQPRTLSGSLWYPNKQGVE